MGDCIYYHFFDRELRNSVKAALSDRIICKIISISLLMTDRFFYLPISNLYESSMEFHNSIQYIRRLEALGLVLPASSHTSEENFILSRQQIYSHDKERYPMYFDSDTHLWTNRFLSLQGSTTEMLKKNLIESSFTIAEFDRKKNFDISESIKGITEKSTQAITFSLFKHSINDLASSQAESAVIANTVKQTISALYTQRYLDISSGTLVTGIDQINYYDKLAKDKLTTNYYIFSYILKTIGLDIDSPTLFDLLLTIRNEVNIFQHIYKQLFVLTKSLANLLESQKFWLINDCNRYLYSAKRYEKINDPTSFFTNLDRYLMDISNRHTDLEKELEKMNKSPQSLVIVAVTSVEMKSLINSIRKAFTSQLIVERVKGDLVYRELVGCKTPVYIVQSEMGISGTGSIINTMHKIHDNLNPAKVVMVGIAFGINKEKQKIGNVLVSKQVWNYEPSKVTENENISRGDKIPASSFLLQLFRSAELEYQIPVQFGLIASGEKLINSVEFLTQLRESEPEIIGGDMEAAGLASACVEKQIEWIVIKAICDWGYEKEDAGQQLAADNASDFLVRGLSSILF